MCTNQLPCSEEEEWVEERRNQILIWMWSYIWPRLTVPGTVASACMTSHKPVSSSFTYTICRKSQQSPKYKCPVIFTEHHVLSWFLLNLLLVNLSLLLFLSDFLNLSCIIHFKRHISLQTCIWVSRLELILFSFTWWKYPKENNSVHYMLWM